MSPIHDADVLLRLLYRLDPDGRSMPNQPQQIGLRYGDGQRWILNPVVLDALREVAPGAEFLTSPMGVAYDEHAMADLVEIGAVEYVRRFSDVQFVRLTRATRKVMRDGAQTVEAVERILTQPGSPQVQITMRDSYGPVANSGPVNQTINISQQAYRSTVTTLTSIGFSTEQAFDLADTVQAEAIESQKPEVGPRGLDLLAMLASRAARVAGTGAVGAVAGELVDQALPVLTEWASAVIGAVGG